MRHTYNNKTSTMVVNQEYCGAISWWMICAVCSWERSLSATLSHEAEGSRQSAIIMTAVSSVCPRPGNCVITMTAIPSVRLRKLFTKTIRPLLCNFLWKFVLYLFGKLCFGWLRYVVICTFHIRFVRYHIFIKITRIRLFTQDFGCKVAFLTLGAP